MLSTTTKPLKIDFTLRVCLQRAGTFYAPGSGRNSREFDSPTFRPRPRARHFSQNSLTDSWRIRRHLTRNESQPTTAISYLQFPVGEVRYIVRRAVWRPEQRRVWAREPVAQWKEAAQTCGLLFK
jgi:hypothetical protein